MVNDDRIKRKLPSWLVDGDTSKKAYKPCFQKRNISKTQFSSLVYLEEKFGKISEMLQLVTPTTFLITNSKPLVDLYVIEARWGHISKGK